MLGTSTLSKAELCLSVRKQQPIGTKCCCLPCEPAYGVRRVRSVCVCISVQHLSISWTMPRSAASTGSNRTCSSPILASAAVMNVECEGWSSRHLLSGGPGTWSTGQRYPHGCFSWQPSSWFADSCLLTALSIRSHKEAGSSWRLISITSSEPNHLSKVLSKRLHVRDEGVAYSAAFWIFLREPSASWVSSQHSAQDVVCFFQAYSMLSALCSKGLSIRITHY